MKNIIDKKNQLKELLSRNIKIEKRKKIKIKDISMLCKQIAILIESGISITNSLEILAYENDNKNLKNTLQKLNENIIAGNSISESMKDREYGFPEALIHMVKIGEETGQLDIVMEDMSEYYEKEYKNQKRITTSMIYPIILSIVVVFVTIFLILFIVPSFVNIFNNSEVELPLPTKLLILVSKVISKYWYIILLTINILILYFSKKYKSIEFKKKIHKKIIRVFFLKKHLMNIIMARFSRTLALLHNSGINIIETLNISKNVIRNKYIEEKIENIGEEIKKGSSLFISLDCIEEIPILFKTMVKIGEETGNLDIVLKKIADYYDKEVESSINKMISLIEPIITIVMAIIVGFIVISIALPMFTMFDTVQNI